MEHLTPKEKEEARQFLDLYEDSRNERVTRLERIVRSLLTGKSLPFDSHGNLHPDGAKNVVRFAKLIEKEMDSK